jgi:two-component system response regulator YesN
MFQEMLQCKGGTPLYKLLIVDDEFEIRHGISHYFPWDELGFSIAGDAENGQQALDFLVDCPVDVILCDIKMPVKSGLDLARELFANQVKIKIVFLSGHKDFEFVKEALIYGARDYIVKPTKYKELAAVFSKIKVELDRESKPDSTLQPLNQVSDDDVLINKIKSYVEQNFPTACLKDAASIVHMNPYYVSTYFKKKTGYSFSDYVIATKMEKAAEYLANPQYKTYEISEMVGYGNPKNFSKSFKAFYGKNPREYRINLDEKW